VHCTDNNIRLPARTIKTETKNANWKLTNETHTIQYVCWRCCCNKFGLGVPTEDDFTIGYISVCDETLSVFLEHAVDLIVKFVFSETLCLKIVTCTNTLYRSVIHTLRQNSKKYSKSLCLFKSSWSVPWWRFVWFCDSSADDRRLRANTHREWE